MHLTRESEYALLGLAHLARSAAGRAISLADIATEQDLPATFLAKIFQKLARHGLLTSERGRGRGYALARPAGEITVREILEAVEGPKVLDRCLLWTGHCGDVAPCPLHYRLKELRPALESLLESVTLAEYLEQSPHAGRAKARLVRGRRPEAPARRLRVIPLLVGLWVAGAAGAAAAPAGGAGDPRAGKDLFTGTRRLSNGGPPCMACHSIGGIGALGGGALGPELTGAYAKFGEEGLPPILASLPFPTMSPIFSNRPLTPEEQANLMAYFREAATLTRPVGAAGRLAVMSAAGLLLFLALAHFTWRGRLRAVRGALVRGAR